MAGTTEYTTATGNDYAEHEGTYTLVMKLSKITTAVVIVIMISFAIGGVTGPWWLCGLGVVAAIVAGVFGAMSEKGTIVPVICVGAAVSALWLVV